MELPDYDVINRLYERVNLNDREITFICYSINLVY